MKNRLVLAALISVCATACVPQQQYNQEVQQVQQLTYMDNTYKQLNQNLQSEVNTDQVQIKQLKNRLQVTMVNAILFPTSCRRWHSASITPLRQTIPGKDARKIAVSTS